jgi:hypothetical protein
MDAMDTVLRWKSRIINATTGRKKGLKSKT